jgi:uncharacterized protein (TIGR00730 family)
MAEDLHPPRHPTSLDEELLEAETTAILSELSDAQRVLRIQDELRAGFTTLKHIGKAVSFFGSARTPRDHPRYQAAREMARTLGHHGFAIITGGGPGIMEAANRGAREAGVPSVGLGIDLPNEQGVNEYVDVELDFHYFFARKVMFVRYASGFVVYPGGFGTLDEMFEAATLRQHRRGRREHARGLRRGAPCPEHPRGRRAPPPARRLISRPGRCSGSSAGRSRGRTRA